MQTVSVEKLHCVCLPASEFLPLGRQPGPLHLPDGAAGPQREALLPRRHRERRPDDAHHLHAHRRPCLPEVRHDLQEAQVTEPVDLCIYINYTSMTEPVPNKPHGFCGR